jgi:hypothetical protein
MGIIPMFQGKEIEPSGIYHYKHYSENGYYRLKVERGLEYVFSLGFSDYDIQPEIQLFSSSLKIVGLTTAPDNPYSSYFSLKFRASHNGYYYVSVLNSKGGYFSVQLRRDNSSYYHELTNTYTNIWKLLLAILASLLLAASSVLFLRLKKNKKKEDRIKNGFRTCPSCGMTCDIKKDYCTTCGYTFAKPKEYKNY